MLPTIEQHCEWIAETLTKMRNEDLTKIATTLQDEEDWMDHSRDVLGGIRGHPGCSSWYTGDNVPGKPRVLSPHLPIGSAVDANAACDGERRGKR